MAAAAGIIQGLGAIGGLISSNIGRRRRRRERERGLQRIEEQRQMVQGLAQGEGPSLGRELLQTGLDQALLQQRAIANTARGGALQQALAQRQAARVGGLLQTQAAQQAAQLRAQEQLAAIQMLNQLVLGQAGVGLQSNQQAAQEQAALSQSIGRALGSTGEFIQRQQAIGQAGNNQGGQ